MIKTSELLKMFDKDQSPKTSFVQNSQSYITPRHTDTFEYSRTDSRREKAFSPDQISDMKKFIPALVQPNQDINSEIAIPSHNRLTIDPVKPTYNMQDINEIYFPEITPSKVTDFQRPTTISPRFKRRLNSDTSIDSLK